jgi:serpin B
VRWRSVRCPDLAQVVDGMAGFAGRLHRVTATTTDSWTVSPLSVAVAFGMLRAGARGGTATELDRVLGFPSGGSPAGAAHPTLNALISAIVTTDPVSRDPAAAPSGGAPFVWAVVHEPSGCPVFTGHVVDPAR